MKEKIWRIRNENGFTLLEMLISLAILGFIVVVTFQLFHMTNNSWLRADAQTKSAQSARTAIQMIGDDIRSSQKPNDLTRAVVVPGTGDTMDIYRYNSVLSRFEQIRYHLNSGSLQRALVYRSTRMDTLNPDYGMSTAAWSTVASNISASAGNIFADTSPVVTPERERRRVAVSFQVNDPSGKGLISPYKVNGEYTTRSQEIGDLASGGGGSASIRVTGISVSPNSTIISSSSTTFDATVTVYPNDATIKTFSFNPSGTIAMTCSLLNPTTIHIQVPKNTSSTTHLYGTVTITSNDEDHWSTVINVEQKGQWR